jgi:hypothetical protein
MANKIIAYQDDHGTKYGATEEESLQALFADYCAVVEQTLTAPFDTTFADLTALQAVNGWSGAIAMPAGLTPRKVSLGLAEASGNGIATVAAICGSETVFAALEPSGATPFPTDAETLTGMTAAIVGTAGEARASN